MIDAGLHPRGPHPLNLLLALAMRHTQQNPGEMGRFLAGLRRYQEASTADPAPALEAYARSGGVILRRLAPATARPAAKAPAAVVLVPSLINAPTVLHMSADRSLLGYLASRGHDMHLVDWGNGLGSERRLGLSGMVSVRLMPLLQRIGRPVILIGYCLGGPLALAAARLLGTQCRGLALLSAPWHADGYAPDARQQAAATWRALQPTARMLGAVPISMLNPMFWALDEIGVVQKYQRLADVSPSDPRARWFSTVEDWANSGAPLSLAAARDLFVQGFGQDRIGRGRWKVGGVPIRPEDLPCPVLDIGATADRIVPDAVRIRIAGVERRHIAAGHVGMIIGSKAAGQLWAPLSNWLQDR